MNDIINVELTVTYINRYNVEQKVTLTLENPKLLIEKGSQFVDHKGRGALMMTYDGITKKSWESK